MKMKFKPGDFIVFVSLFILSLYLISKVKLSGGDKFTVTSCGKEYEYSLLENKTYEVQGKLGITEIEVNNKRVRIINSPCKNKTCVHQGWGKNIICLPNDVVITVIKEDDFDAIAQ